MISKHKYIFLILWLALLGLGFYRLYQYSNAPGSAANAGLSWPSNSRIARNKNMPSLLLFLHPKCSCSLATLAELERLMPSAIGKLQITVLFFKPKSYPVAWALDSSWEKASRIPSIHLAVDEDGAELRIFGAKTSGQSFLYDQDGHLLFEGGLTPSRGHMGDSPGRFAILSFLETGNMTIKHSSVFGCSFVSPNNSKMKHSI